MGCLSDRTGIPDPLPAARHPTFQGSNPPTTSVMSTNHLGGMMRSKGREGSWQYGDAAYYLLEPRCPGYAQLRAAQVRCGTTHQNLRSREPHAPRAASTCWTIDPPIQANGEHIHNSRCPGARSAKSATDPSPTTRRKLEISYLPIIERLN